MRLSCVCTTATADAAVIPDLASMKYFIRAPTVKAVVALREKVIPCFEWVFPSPASRLTRARAAAKATGCKLKITTDELTYDLRNVAPLAVSPFAARVDRTPLMGQDEYAACVGDLYGTKTYINLKYDPNAALASTDFGNVTYALPS